MTGPTNLAERPRERMMVFGPERLSDTDLIALLLGGGQAVERAHRVLETVGGLPGLGVALSAEIARCPGVGPARATALAAAVELGRRLERARRPWAERVRRPSDAAAVVRGRLRGATQEHFVVIGLDARQRVTMVRTVALGSLAQVDVHPRELFRPLVRSGVHSCVLVHNHPSGDPEPSEADVELTLRMAEVGHLVGIPVLDHVVVTDDASTSLAALGLLD
jgi:DNA repair protein RadC